MTTSTNSGNAVWIPAREAWANFCKVNPGLGLNGTKHSFVWFARTHGAKMIAAGAMRRAVSRRYLAHSDTFNQVAFDLLTVEGQQ